MKQLILGAIAAFSLQAQTQPSADIVRSVRETYARITSIEFSMKLTNRAAGNSKGSSETTMTVKAARMPDKLRLEAGGSELEPSLTVFDGKNTWTYLPNRNQYSVQTGSDMPLPFSVAQFLPTIYELKDDEAKLLREESIEANGKQVNCYVIEIPQDSEAFVPPKLWTWWVDKGEYVIVRAESRMMPNGGDEPTMVRTTAYQNITLNKSIPDDVFVFTPPPGAQKVEDLQ